MFFLQRVDISIASVLRATSSSRLAATAPASGTFLDLLHSPRSSYLGHPRSTNSTRHTRRYQSRQNPHRRVCRLRPTLFRRKLRDHLSPRPRHLNVTLQLFHCRQFMLPNNFMPTVNALNPHHAFALFGRPPPPASPRSRAPHRAAGCASRPSGFDRCRIECTSTIARTRSLPCTSAPITNTESTAQHRDAVHARASNFREPHAIAVFVIFTFRNS